MTDSNVRKIVQQELRNSQYKVGGVPFHIHNGIDSPKIQVSSSGSSFKAVTGQFDRTLTASSSTTVLSHGLGTTPSFFQLNGFTYATGVGDTYNIGTYDGTTQAFVSVQTTDQSWGTGSVLFFGSNTNGQQGTVTWDSSNITITWTLYGSGVTGQLHCVWSAFA